MPQFEYRANLSSAVFPMTLAKAGRTVINPGPDQNFDKRIDAAGNDKSSVGIPQAIYMENVLPTPDGFQSVGYKPVLGFEGTDPVISSVERVRLAINSAATIVAGDVDTEDDGTDADLWSKSGNVLFAGGVPPSGSAAIPFWESITSNPAVGGNPTSYYEFADHRVSNSASEANFPPFWHRDFGVANTSDATIDAEVIFLESELAISEATADAFPEKIFIIGVCGLSSGSGIKVIYNEADNTIRIANRGNFSLESMTSQASGAVSALNYDEWYSVNITWVKDGSLNLTVTATITDSTLTVMGTVSAFYAAGTYPSGGYIGIGRQSIRHDSTDADFQSPLTTFDPPTLGSKAEFVLLTNAGTGPLGTYASQRTGFDNLHVVAVIADTETTVVSGVANIDIAFKGGADYDTTWSPASSEDWLANPVQSVADLILDSTTEFSTATVRGIAYVCIRNAGVTKIFELSFLPSPDEDTLVFTDITAIIGATFSVTFTTDDIVGISGSFNYLLLHTATVLFWSSTTTPTDFAASLVSGAGSETPGNLKGDITFIKEHVGGFYIYTTNNVIFSAYTGNRAYPWKFREIAGSGGFSFNSQVSGDTNASVHYGLNNARFIQVLAPAEANVQSPEVTDFLERIKRWDLFDSTTNAFSVFADTPGSATSLINLAEPRIWFVLDRYILVPFGLVSGQYTYCIVFDSLLNRYGRLRITFNSISTDDTNIYFLDYELKTRKKLYFDMRYSGIAQSEAFQHRGVLVLGKFQMLRGDFLQLEGVEIESAVTDSAGQFTVHLIPSLDGKTFRPAVELTKIVNINPDIAVYPAHTVGQNVSLLLKGAFDLNTIQLTAQSGGKV